MGFMMSSYLKLDDKYDICLSMTWYPGGSHLISGHVFEIIDYYILLSKRYNVCILFGDTFDTWKQLKATIVSKYCLTDQQLDQIECSTYYATFPRYVMGRNILFVDGGLLRLEKLGTKLIFDNVLTFKCSYQETIHDLLYDVVVLQDDRVYHEHNPEDTTISINYRKKIYFDILKKQPCSIEDIAMMYLTKNCRSMSNEKVMNTIQKYPFKKYIIVTDDPDTYQQQHNVEILQPPVSDIFTTFSTYIYTPLKGRFDGSPRFPVECKYYDKQVIYHDDIDDEYLKKDTGLYWRKHDICNNFSELSLNVDDGIFNILADIINEPV